MEQIKCRNGPMHIQTTDLLKAEKGKMVVSIKGAESTRYPHLKIETKRNLSPTSYHTQE